MKNKKWILLGIIGGALMIISSVVGRVGIIGRLLELLAGVVNEEAQRVIGIILTIFTYIAAGGGITVIVGALITGFSSNFVGRYVMGIGIGASLISLIILLITSIYGGSTVEDLPQILLNTFNGIYGLAGAFIAIFARLKLKD